MSDGWKEWAAELRKQGYRNVERYGWGALADSPKDGVRTHVIRSKDSAERVVNRMPPSPFSEHSRHEPTVTMPLSTFNKMRKNRREDE